MKGQSRGRKRDQEARREWTVRLNRFAGAKSTKQRQAVFETSHKINPGGTLREMLHAWGYSPSARGRKAKGVKDNGSGKTARERLQATLNQLFGVKPSPVPSLYQKLAGRSYATVRDASRIVSALIVSWPEKLDLAAGTDATALSGDEAYKLADAFMRELLSELSAGRSRDWSADDIEARGFRLLDEVRIGVRNFIKEAGEEEGALIVAGARNTLIGPDPVETVKEFHEVTSQFIGKDHKGILIFVFDAAIFEAGREGFNLLYNIGLLSTAITSFALFPQDYDYNYPVQQHKVDWSRWRTFSKRCCVVLKRPTIIDPDTGELLKREKIDRFIEGWRPKLDFESLAELSGFIRFDSNHVLPREYPAQFGNIETLTGKDLYWDVLVRPSPQRPQDLDVQYFVPPVQYVVESAQYQNKHEGRGRPGVNILPIEEDLFYVVKQDSPGSYYDDAQRAIYMAARGRLNLDSDEQHARNLNAAAALRQVGFEVLPISIMLSLFPRALHFAAGQHADKTVDA